MEAVDKTPMVYPSGGLFFRAVMAMAVPPPGLLRQMTGCPKVLPALSAKARTGRSVAPPGV